MIKLFESEDSTTEEAWTMEDVVSYVKQYLVYEEEIKALQESRREWSKEFLEEKNIPKKELTQAIAIVKKDLNFDVLTDIHTNISKVFDD